jgi:pimeloyl-ACP methyl ester carboxylesterase
MDDDGLRRIRAADGRTLCYEVNGNRVGADGPPVVFLHGSLANRFSFRKVRPSFEATRPVVATVLRGHADEDDRTLPADYGLATTEVDDLLSVLDAEGIEQADLFAHSTGGSIAIALASRQPDRVRRLVLIEPTLLPLLGGAMAARVGADAERMVAAADDGDHVLALRRLLDFIGGSAWHASDPASRQRVVDALAPLAPLTGPHVRALVGLAVEEADLSALPQPTLLIYGAQSAYFESSIAEVLARLRPDLTQIRVEGTGHNAHLERPDLVGPAAAAFLRR